ncbi:MAG: elongation factor P [Polyangiaceae bacterium]
MASTTDIRKGLRIQIDGNPFHIVEHQFVRPGKGQAFTRCRIRNLSTGAVIERTWKSGESVELADVEDRKMTYSWDEGETYVFMDPNTGDQIHVEKYKLGDETRFLSEGLEVVVTLFNGSAVGVELPPNVVLQIVNSEPGVKGDTASGATKPATLSTGAVINVPLFVKEGEWVKVETATGQYQERVNK